MIPSQIAQTFETQILKSIEDKFLVDRDQLSLLKEESYKSEVDPEIYGFMILDKKGPMYLVLADLKSDETLHIRDVRYL